VAGSADACTINQVSSNMAFPHWSAIVQSMSWIWRAIQNKSANSYTIEIAM
jgi:hypothetical protein